jgi:UV DNA damage endonuclease
MNKIRISIQTSKTCKLSSNKEDIGVSSIEEINKISQFFDLMALSATNYYTIVTNVGGSYNNKLISCDRFCENHLKLSEHARKRLAVTNDYKTGGYTIKDLYNLLFLRINIPIVFNNLHHRNLSNDLSEKDALDLSLSTWNNDIKALVYHSNSKKTYENVSAKEYETADNIHTIIENYNYDVIVLTNFNEMSVIQYKINNNFLLLSVT